MKRWLLFSSTIILTVLESCFLPGYADSTSTIQAKYESIAQAQVNCNNPKNNLEIKECILKQIYDTSKITV